MYGKSFDGERETVDLALLSELRYCKSARHLAARLEELIDTGGLLPGELLPSTREIATFLQVSRTTVSRAFNMMEARGFFTAHQGQGTIVSSHYFERTIDFSPSASRQFDWTARCPEEASRKLNCMQNRLRKNSKYDSSVSLDLLPLASWKSAFASAVTDPEIGFKLSLGDAPLGYLPLREAVSGLLQRSKGLLCPAGRVAIYSSEESALQHICELLVAPQDKIACDDSISNCAFEVFNSTGAGLCPVKSDKDGLRIQELSRADTPNWLYLSGCGAALSKERSNRFYEWLREKSVVVIEEADYAESYVGASHASTILSSLAPNSHIFLYNFSKLLFPLTGFCCLVLPPELVTVFERTKHFFDSRPLLLEDHVVAGLMNDGTLEKHRYSAQKLLKQRKQTLISELMSSLANNVRFLDSRSLFSISLRFDRKWNRSDIVTASSSANLPLHPLSEDSFAAISDGNDFSIDFSSLPVDELQKRTGAFSRNLRFAKSVPYLLQDCSNLAV